MHYFSSQPGTYRCRPFSQSFHRAESPFAWLILLAGIRHQKSSSYLLLGHGLEYTRSILPFPLNDLDYYE